ncbi:sortase [Patescibacteria group bacterium]|nr:sortase [Patescibacteria group bacterium]
MSFPRILKNLGLLVLGLLIPLSTFAKTFSDVPAYYKHYQAITQLSDLGVINGYSDGSFRPDQMISRAEAAKLLVSSIKSDEFIQKATNSFVKSGFGSPFYDVSFNEWFGPYVIMAKQYSMVDGYPDGSFGPGNTINFAEGLKMILQSYGADVHSERFVGRPLLYVGGHEWFAPYFNYASSHHLINPDKFYHPAQLMTRGEFSEILYRIKTIKEEGLAQVPITQPPFSNEYTITIPHLDIVDVNVFFANPYDSDGALGTLRGGMGHYLSPPGGGGKMVLFGHSSGYNWDNSSYKQLLRQIDRLGIGDLIYINYQEKGYVYQINKKDILPAEQLGAVMTDYGYEEVAMYTCWPPDGISHRYVVYAARL